MTAEASRVLARARLPAWCLPAPWPTERGEPALADIRIASGRVVAVEPSDPREPGGDDLEGALVLPGLVEAHVHLDKAFTARRARPAQPGLLGAVDAAVADRARATTQDIRDRANRGIDWAIEAGVARMRTHVDWWDPASAPPAWQVLEEIAAERSTELRLERVGFVPLRFLASREDARSVARLVAGSGPDTLLGGFVHSSNLEDAALRRLVEAAAEAGLDLDLHVDEELEPEAAGFATLIRIARETRYEGRMVCGHLCALAAMPEARALALLDEAARSQVSIVALPLTNLLLQDALTDRTPRARGLTLVKEARLRGIPVFVASDNVQDPFCAFGSFDPVEALASAVLAAQFDSPFDRWSDSICRTDALRREPSMPFLSQNSPADFTIFETRDASSWPFRAGTRRRVRAGRLIDVGRTEKTP